MKRSKSTDKRSSRTPSAGRRTGGRGATSQSKRRVWKEVSIDALRADLTPLTETEKLTIRTQLLTRMLGGEVGMNTPSVSSVDETASKCSAKTATTPRPNEKTPSGRKYDNGKPRLELLSSKAMTEIAKVMTFGAQKYDAHNWRGGIAWGRVLGAALRHISAFNDGQDKDPETGLSHLAHAGCCIMFLLEYEATHRDLDDRYKGDK